MFKNIQLLSSGSHAVQVEDAGQKDADLRTGANHETNALKHQLTGAIFT